MIAYPKIIIALSGIAALCLAIWYYGNTRYNAGVLSTVAEYEAADKKGAETVNETSRKILNSISADADPDGLLAETGGLRD